jgi:hypothetical protein
MNSVPLIRRALCAAAPGKTQAFGKRKLRQNASFGCDNRGAAALSFGYDFPL